MRSVSSLPTISRILSTEMFSSCSPCSALVDGVNSGWGNLSDSRMPAGRAKPQTVVSFRYALQNEPLR